MEKIKYIAIYKNKDILRDNNLYCDNFNDLLIFIDSFINLGIYKNLDDFLEDYEICNLVHCKSMNIKRGFKKFCDRNIMG